LLEEQERKVGELLDRLEQERKETKERVSEVEKTHSEEVKKLKKEVEVKEVRLGVLEKELSEVKLKNDSLVVVEQLFKNLQNSHAQQEIILREKNQEVSSFNNKLQKLEDKAKVE
jgi:hypothetical protein